MRLIVAAVGRLKSGPEKALCERYAGRIPPLLRGIGFSGLTLVEVGESHQRQGDARKRDEAAALKAALPARSTLVLFDERGKAASSETFAASIGQWQQSGADALCFVIGGPDGLDPGMRETAAAVLSFGAMTMPHQIVRALVLEQIYRAGTLLSGHPYHRA